ncbi:MAG: radical SAM protein [Rubrivivax sp.]
MKILCLVAPYVPSYFNAGHHINVYTVANHLRRTKPGSDVTCIDACARRWTWRDLAEALLEPFDLVLLQNDFDAVDTFERTIRYIRTLLPDAKVATFGRLGAYAPGFFERAGCDAVHVSGDPETSMAAYADYLDGLVHSPAGCRHRDWDGAWKTPAMGGFLSVEDWPFPEARDLQIEASSAFYANDLNKFCGIPQRRELVVPVARGCPVNCSFCDVPRLQGLKERRVSVQQVFRYVDDMRQAGTQFDYVSFYAPTFTLKRNWVLELCDEIVRRDVPWRWKCVTTVSHLDAELVSRMAAAGCVRISVGIETLSPVDADVLPASKKDVRERLAALAGWCRETSIELNCFIVLGLPGDSLAGVRSTIEELRRLGARVRPTIYTNYDAITQDMGALEIGMFNRQLMGPDEHRDARAFNRMGLRLDDDVATSVQTHVPIFPLAPSAP